MGLRIDIFRKRKVVAKREAPVITGHLRKNIKVFRVRRLNYRLGIDLRTVDYALFVHEGTRFIKPNRFLVRALRGVGKDLEKVIKKWETTLKRKYQWR